MWTLHVALLTYMKPYHIYCTKPLREQQMNDELPLGPSLIS